MSCLRSLVPDDLCVPAAPGDLFACWSPAPVGRWISALTAVPWGPSHLRWGPSHIAVAAPCHGQMLWWESTTQCPHPCVLLDRQVEGVQAQHPEQRVSDYLAAGGRVIQYSLTDLYGLSAPQVELLAWWLQRWLGKHYDTPGALRSGTRLYHWSHFFPAADLHSLFCSELVAALLMRLGRLPIGNPTRYNPARLLRQLVQSGVYAEVRQWSV